MKIEYNKNNYFQFKNQIIFEIDNNLVNSINTNFKNLSNKNLSQKSKELIFKDIKIKMNAVFDSLILQSGNDKYLKFFYAELKALCGKHIIELQSYYFSIKNNNSETNELHDEGFFFGNLSSSALDKINFIAKKSIRKLKSRINENNLNREKLSINKGLDIRKIRSILNQEFKKENILKKVSTYMKKEYHVSGLALELSVPNSKWWKDIQSNTVEPKTMYAHIDESEIYPKSICYLSDVNNENGPTSIYPHTLKNLNLNFLQLVIGKVIGNIGKSKKSYLKEYYNRNFHQSMSCKNFRKHFMSLPKSLKFNSHFGWDIIPNTELENLLEKNEIKLIGNAGKFIVFDGGNVIHRGGLINKGERVALQIVFGPKISLPIKIINKLKELINCF
tara:strand:- start:247 stop:1416 length:1170 start_codon:yes stop_codon:yes gene_type:complete